MNIGIVAHRLREEAARQLERDVAADHVGFDDTGMGCRGNHTAVWRWHAEHPAAWAVTLEDDARPVGEFRTQLTAALAVAPAPVVSLYLGTGYIDDRRTGATVQWAEKTDACWLLTGTVRSAVGLAISGDYVNELVAGLGHGSQAIDRAIGQWVRRRGLKVAYTMPSLVDHADIPSLVSRFRRAPRRAWRVGKRERWTDHAMPAE